MVLFLANKAMNGTFNEDRLVPSLRVFGVCPRFSALNTKHPNQIDLINTLSTARKITGSNNICTENNSSCFF